MGIKEFLKKKRDTRFYVGVMAIELSLLLLFTVYTVSGKRLFYSFMDLGISFAYYFLFIFDMQELVTPTVNTPIDVDINKFLPFSLLEVERKLDLLWRKLFDFGNFTDYLEFVLKVLSILSILITGFLPVVIVAAYILFGRYTSEHVPTSEQMREKRFVTLVFSAVNKVVTTYKRLFEYFQERKAFVILFVLIWLVNTNALTVAVEFFILRDLICSDSDFSKA